MTAQTSTPSQPRAWVRFTMSPTMHKRLLSQAHKHGGNLGTLLYSVARKTFPTVLPERYPRVIRWKTDHYMGAMFVRLFLTPNEVFRMNSALTVGRTVEEVLNASLSLQFAKVEQAELF